MIKGQLEGVLPQLERTSRASIADLEKRAGIANAQLTSSIEGLEKRDQEMSAKPKSNRSIRRWSRCSSRRRR